MPCPLAECNGQLSLYHDHAAGGAWACCSNCRFAGDTIELAAAYWKGLELPIVIKKLLSLGIKIPDERILPDNIAQYIRFHPGKRKRFWDFWQQSQKRLLVDDSKVLRALQHKLGLRLTMDRDRWLHGPGLFVGGGNKHDIEAVYQPGVAEHTKGLQNTGKVRVFNGPGWIEMLTIPFSDLPGRIKGFLFIGREAQQPKDVTFSLVRYSSSYIADNYARKKRSLDLDCGLALYEGLTYATHQVIVMSDPILAMRMQCWHLQDHGTPAPIVSIFANAAVHTHPSIWGQIKQTPVFWGKPDGELFRHAKETNAKVCLAGFTYAGPIRSFTRTPLSEWLQRVEMEARPWDEVLEQLLHDLPVAEAESIILNMGFTSGDLQRFIELCPEPLRQRIEPCCVKAPARTIAENGVSIREDNGWYLEHTSEQICNAILRIDQVVYHEKLDQSYYAGRILFMNSEVPFCEPAEVVENETFHWMRKKLLKTTSGFFAYAPKWETQAVALATRFHPPEVSKGFNAIGWDSERACFVFPSFIISSKGDVVEDQRIKITKQRTPALMLDKPAPLSTEDIAALPQGAGAAVFWATAACVASNLLAPVFGVPISGIGFVGSCAETTGRATANMLGCAEYAIQERRANRGEDALETICTEHGWPLFLKPPKTRLDTWIAWLTSNERKNCVVPLSWYTAKVLAARTGWHLIEAGNYVAPIEICEAARKVLPSFLQYVAKQQFKLPAGYKCTDGKGLARIVLVWLSQWFAAVGGNYKVVLSALKVTNFDGDLKRRRRAGEAFIDLLCRLFDDGELALEHAGFIPTGKAIRALICFPNEGGSIGRIFVPKAVINKLLLTHNAPMFDATATSRALQEVGAVEHEYAGLPGWMLSEEMWNKRLSAWRAWHKYKLRVE